jgi:hypothetical protein
MSQPHNGDPAHWPNGQPDSAPTHPSAGGTPDQPPAPPQSAPYPQPAPSWQPAPYPQPAPSSPSAPKTSRALLITSLVLAVVLVLCGGGGLAAFFLLRGAPGGEGASEPVAAVDGFLRAVYTDRDANKAASLVCREARDSAKIRKKVDEVRNYSRSYDNPRFKWDVPKVDDQNADRAVVSVKLTMITGDDKTSDQQLRFTVVQKTGWWVCEVG